MYAADERYQQQPTQAAAAPSGNSSRPHNQQQQLGGSAASTSAPSLVTKGQPTSMMGSSSSGATGGGGGIRVGQCHSAINGSPSIAASSTAPQQQQRPPLPTMYRAYNNQPQQSPSTPAGATTVHIGGHGNMPSAASPNEVSLYVRTGEKILADQLAHKELTNSVKALANNLTASYPFVRVKGLQQLMHVLKMVTQASYNPLTGHPIDNMMGVGVPNAMRVSWAATQAALNTNLISPMFHKIFPRRDLILALAGGQGIPLHVLSKEAALQWTPCTKPEMLMKLADSAENAADSSIMAVGAAFGPLVGASAAAAGVQKKQSKDATNTSSPSPDAPFPRQETEIILVENSMKLPSKDNTTSPAADPSNNNVSSAAAASSLLLNLPNTKEALVTQARQQGIQKGILAARRALHDVSIYEQEMALRAIQGLCILVPQQKINVSESPLIPMLVEACHCCLQHVQQLALLERDIRMNCSDVVRRSVEYARYHEALLAQHEAQLKTAIDEKRRAVKQQQAENNAVFNAAVKANVDKGVAERSLQQQQGLDEQMRREEEAFNAEMAREEGRELQYQQQQQQQQSGGGGGGLRRNASSHRRTTSEGDDGLEREEDSESRDPLAATTGGIRERSSGSSLISRNASSRHLGLRRNASSLSSRRGGVGGGDDNETQSTAVAELPSVSFLSPQHEQGSSASTTHHHRDPHARTRSNSSQRDRSREGGKGGEDDDDDAEEHFAATYKSVSTTATNDPTTSAAAAGTSASSLRPRNNRRNNNNDSSHKRTLSKSVGFMDDDAAMINLRTTSTFVDLQKEADAEEEGGSTAANPRHNGGTTIDATALSPQISPTLAAASAAAGDDGQMMPPPLNVAHISPRGVRGGGGEGVVAGEGQFPAAAAAAGPTVLPPSPPHHHHHHHHSQNVGGGATSGKPNTNPNIPGGFHGGGTLQHPEVLLMRPQLIAVMCALIDAVEAACHFCSKSLAHLVQVGAVKQMLGLACCPYTPVPIRCAIFDTISLLMKQTDPFRRAVLSGPSEPLAAMTPAGDETKATQFYLDRATASKFDSTVRSWLSTNHLFSCANTLLTLRDVGGIEVPPVAGAGGAGLGVGGGGDGADGGGGPSSSAAATAANRAEVQRMAHRTSRQREKMYTDFITEVNQRLVGIV